MTEEYQSSPVDVTPRVHRKLKEVRSYSGLKRFLNLYRILYKTCKKSRTSFIRVVLREFYGLLVYRKRMWLHPRVLVRGMENIELKGILSIGISYVGFMHVKDRTFLNVLGRLSINGDYYIGKGCRFDIGTNGKVVIGKGGYITANSTFIIMHELTIGDNCAISWDCQFLDEDFHEIIYAGKKAGDPSIRIGNHVWIGCGVKVYKGSVIPDHCVVASNSIVKGVFTAKNALIGGNPARVLKENIDWK